MTQSKLPKHKHEAYTHRDVASLPPPFTQWTHSFELIQRTHNRILQPGFMHRDVDAVLADARAAGVAWLTDVCCPSAKADIMLHISKEMVVNYQVADKDLNTAAHAVYASYVNDIEKEMLQSIEDGVDFEMEIFEREKAAQIEQAARKMLIDNFKYKDNGKDQPKGMKNEDITLEQLAAAKRIVVDKERRRVMDTIVPKVVKEHLAEKAGELGLLRKTCHTIGETEDFFYGGPAGSGKSTISKIDISEDGTDPSKINKKDCVTVATDIYRAFTLPGTEGHEQIQTKDIFTRTQDIAYMVKEQVLQELKDLSHRYGLALMSSLPGNDIAQAEDGKVYLSENPREYYVKGMIAPAPIPPEIDLTNLATKLNDFAFKDSILWMTSEAGHTLKGERPNLINDGVTVEWDVRVMLKHTGPENLVSKVALYRGDEAGYRGIAERALSRAQKEDADPADKGRYIETTSLFKGHADASRLFLANLPGNAVTEVYDTNVDRDRNEEPVLVAKVDSRAHTVEILNLRIMSEWLNKKNLNIEAEHPVELILKKESSQRVTDPENKATAILDLVKGNPFERPATPFTVVLKNAKGEAYASLVSDGKDKVKLEVTDLEKFKELAARESSPEAQVLRAITRQTKVATAAELDSPEAQAAEFVEQVDKHIASTHETAVEKIAQEAHIASRKRLGEEEDRDRIAYTAALLEARIDLMEEKGPGLDVLETTFNAVVEEERMMELVLGDEQENAITQQAINSLEGVQEFYLKTSGALKNDLDAFFEHHTDAFQLGNLELPVKDLKKLLVRYHPDHNDQGVEQGYKELYEIFAYLKNERDKVNQKGIGKQTEALTTSESPSQIEFSSGEQIPPVLSGGQGSNVDEVEDEDLDSEMAAEMMVAEKVITAAVASPKIVTGNYSALMACLNDILTNTVAIAPDSSSEAHIHLIAEPMWLDSVDQSYDNELWGQSIDAFPPAVQKFARENVDPTLKDGEKLTWGQVRALRAAMLERIKEDKGFTVHEGEIQSVVERTRDGAENPNEKELQINLAGKGPITIPFNDKPIILDLSQRPRPAGPVLSGEPTVLYRHSQDENTGRLKDVPILVSGSGAQAAWVLDKMGNDRTYHISYRGSLDFRIANAILEQQGYDQRFTASTALPKVDAPPLSLALAAYADGVPQTVSYTKDDGTRVDIKISVFPGDKATLLKAADIPEELEEARGLLERAGVKPGEVEGVYAEIISQIRDRDREQNLNAEQLVIQVYKDPARVDVGFAVNATGWVSLKETVARNATPFWGPSAKVATGDELVNAAKLITTGSLLPGSGLPRMLSIKEEIRAMRSEAGVGNTYDVRALAFTGSGFDKMCDECKLPPEFRTKLEAAIKQLATPADAKPNPVDWIVKEYAKWLNDNPQLTQEEEIEFAQFAKEALQNNVKQNIVAEGGVIVEEPKVDVVQQVMQARARDQFSFFGGGATSPIDRRIAELMKKEDLKTLAKEADGFPVKQRKEIIEFFKNEVSQEELMEIKSGSTTAQEAWDQQYGLVLRNQ